MSLEKNIDRALTGQFKPRLSVQKAISIQRAIINDDEDALRRLMLDGYVFFNAIKQEWEVSYEHIHAYDSALARAQHARERKAASQRARAGVYSSLGMKRTRSGSWE